MKTTNVDNSNEDPNVRMCIWGVENVKEQPKVATGAHQAAQAPSFEEQDGKKVFPTKVVQKDDGTVVVMFKKNGEVQTITLDEYAAKQLKENRKRKANPVPAMKKSAKAKGEDR